MNKDSILFRDFGKVIESSPNTRSSCVFSSDYLKKTHDTQAIKQEEQAEETTTHLPNIVDQPVMQATPEEIEEIVRKQVEDKRKKKN